MHRTFNRMACVFLIIAMPWVVAVAASGGSPPIPADDRVVVVPVANIYSAPTEDSDVVSQALYGSTVTVLEDKPGWAKIQTPDHYAGWLPLDQARRISGSNPSYPGPGKTLQVSGLSANLYREPDVTVHRPVLTVPYETRLEFLSEGQGDSAGWFQVRLVDGRSAWIDHDDVIVDPRPLSIDESIELGKRFLGITYPQRSPKTGH